jgi:peptidoglycan DL-endopeptidase CwlO
LAGEDAALVEASPIADDSVIDQGELYDDLRAQLSDRSGRRTGEEAAAAETGAEMETAVLAATATAKPKVATKTATPRPTVRIVTKTPTPKPAPTKTPTPRPTTAPSTSTFGQKVANIALRYVGYRYTYGGTSPSTGFDCSGFAYYVYKVAGRPISRSLSVQYSTGAWVSRSSIRAGDLVFFKNTYRYGLSHVAISIGGGKFVHAQSESTGVRVSYFDTYWSSHYLGARRP